MKGRIVFTVILTLITAACVFFILSFFKSSENPDIFGTAPFINSELKETAERTEPYTDEPDLISSDDNYYIYSQYGMLVVRKGSKFGEFVMETPFDSTVLPREEVQQLISGFTVEGEEKMLTIIEDYTS